MALSTFFGLNAADTMHEVWFFFPFSNTCSSNIKSSPQGSDFQQLAGLGVTISV
jgi:hypothetical protein